MPIQKPVFPNPSVDTVARRLEAMEKRLGSVRAADGSVDMAKLEEAVREARDPGLEKELSWIKDEFSTREMRTVTGGCGGSWNEPVDVPPATLDGEQVRSVMSALVEAKRRVAEHADQDGSGHIERSEAQNPDGGPGLAGHLAREAVRDVHVAFHEQLDAWRLALQGAADKVDPRRGLELNIVGQAERHCATALGRDAVQWAYREMATRHAISSDDVWTIMDMNLADAERSLLRFIPLFGRDLASGDGPHLDDAEVKRLLGADDLASFAQKAQASVEKRLGMAYADWVQGRDIPGADQLEDKDFYRASSGC